MGFLVLAGIGLTALTVMTVVELSHLAKPLDPPTGDRPLVSVLKPLKGADPGLEENLRSFFHQTWPRYELLFGVRDWDDPAVPVVRRLMSTFPGVRAHLVVSDREVGFNPKVNNLANLFDRARGQVILISDSNVRVRPTHLEGLVGELARPGVRLVSSPFRGVGGGSLGAALETLHLNTYVLGGTAAVHRLWGGVCVVGKSMMLRRADLEAIGGFGFLGAFLAEDQVCGQEVHALGGELVLAREVVDNVVGTPTVGDFLARHLRWAIIRRRITLPGYLGEFLLAPSVFALAAVVFRPGILSSCALGVTVALQSGLAALVERRLGFRRPFFLYPALVFLKDLLVTLTWPIPLLRSTVRWRGAAFRVGRRTLLRPGAASSGRAGRRSPRKDLLPLRRVA